MTFLILHKIVIVSFPVNLQSSHASPCGCEPTLQTSSVLLQHESSGLDGGAHWDQPSFAPTEGSTMAERISTSFTLLCRGCPCFRSRFFALERVLTPRPASVYLLPAPRLHVCISFWRPHCVVEQFPAPILQRWQHSVVREWGGLVLV